MAGFLASLHTQAHIHMPICVCKRAKVEKLRFFGKLYILITMLFIIITTTSTKTRHGRLIMGQMLAIIFRSLLGKRNIPPKKAQNK